VQFFIDSYLLFVPTYAHIYIVKIKVKVIPQKAEVPQGFPGGLRCRILFDVSALQWW